MTQKPTRPPTPTPRSARRTSPPRWRGDILRRASRRPLGKFCAWRPRSPTPGGACRLQILTGRAPGSTSSRPRVEPRKRRRCVGPRSRGRSRRPGPRDYIARLPDFEDVEAEHRAFALAARHQDANRGLAFLLDWPALREAADMIEARAEALTPSPEAVELWAARLRRRYPKAAHRLLRLGAARAFRSREYKLCDRLTEEAEAILNVDADDGRRPSGGG